MNGMERKGRSGMRYECNVALKRNAVNEAAYTAGKEQLNKQKGWLAEVAKRTSKPQNPMANSRRV